MTDRGPAKLGFLPCILLVLHMNCNVRMDEIKVCPWLPFLVGVLLV